MASISGTSAVDVFVYAQRRFGSDTITGFEIGKDKIDLSAFHVADLTTLRPYMSQIGSSVVVEMGFDYGRETITLIDTSLAKLLACPKSFIFNTSPDSLTVSGAGGQDILFGGKGADKLFGGGNNDELNAGLGNDQLTGGAGNDLLRGGLGMDVFVFDDRRFGEDTISDFAIGKDKIDLSTFGVADLKTLRPYMSQVGSSVVIEMGFDYGREKITLIDTNLIKLLGSPESFTLNTLPDSLVVSGAGGQDVLFGGNRADKLFGGGNNDELNGGLGNDQLTGGAGNDLLRGGLGKDVFVYDDRRFGEDTIIDFEIGADKLDLSVLHIADRTTLRPYMSQVGSSVVIEMGFDYGREKITLENTNLAKLLASSKNFIFDALPDGLTISGAGGRDVLFGGKGADKLFGYGNSDDLNGGAGNDQLTGGAGNDVLRGGSGADVFYFATGDGYDVIADFRHDQGDIIDLATIDAGSAPGDQALTLIKGNVFTGAGQVLISKEPDHYTVYVNLDGNLTNAELAIDVYSDKALVAADFVL
jgi:serralysin